MLPSLRHDQLGSRIVDLTRLQASLHVAARVLARSIDPFDTPLGRQDLSRATGACYPALRRLPGRDLRPLEKRSSKTELRRSAAHLALLHGAPWRRPCHPQAAPSRTASHAAVMLQCSGVIATCASVSSMRSRDAVLNPDRGAIGSEYPHDSQGPRATTACNRGCGHGRAASRTRLRGNGRSGASVDWRPAPIRDISKRMRVTALSIRIAPPRRCESL